ncbi:transglutaminase domain-containing protein [Flavobacterium cellulosilyticum]|uniref:Transglutaminase domain-containing protein n=1 Tax=Flavobacterium cellulosilyticum TaxID=2541731 RepID=A0A4R5CFZ3_9FLAO|nr:transglutaminase-like domain-containing protein [Flavobacterium cellulosilyticum]TDD98555.1 transglutaminase domain-containing protein [Flavobacterium cellulosilyticum]
MKQKSNTFSLRSILFCVVFSLGMYAQHPAAVEQNLKKAGSNRAELEKAILYCKNSDDPQKLKAIYFLIANMDIHSSSDYYWENEAGNRIVYNELDYPNFDEAAKAFEAVKLQNPNLHPKAITYSDLETIKGDYLINNLDNAFKSWRVSAVKNISFDDFCEYILPYRISVEPIQDWRTTYNSKFSWISDKIETIGLEASLPYVSDEANSWFTNTWNSGGRKEPLPRLGSMQLLLRKQGPCEDLADLGVFTMRSIGIPATADFVPYWGTTRGGHAMNTFFDSNNKAIHFDYGTKEYNEKLRREPAKVLRLTYSKQNQTLASFEEQNNIPKGYLREQNYIDVTQEYWNTRNVKCSLYLNPKPLKTVYACTFSGLKWQPFWWAKVLKNEAQFNQICQGTVVLPQYYSNGKMIPASAPILVGDTETRILTPDLNQLQDLTISSVANYLILKPNVIYKLLYWNDKWQLIDTITATETTESLLFHKVPKNALLLLIASDSKGLERPFIVSEQGERTWY